MVHDAREVHEYAVAHLRGSVNVPADGRMAETVGMVFEPTQKVVVIAPEGQEQEVATRFARIGFDHVVGYIAEPETYFLAHEAEVERASRLDVHELDAAVTRPDVQLVDIRNAGEVAGGIVPGARHIPLAELARRADELDPTQAGPHVLRRRLAQLGRREPAAEPRASPTSPTSSAATAPGSARTPSPPDPARRHFPA